MAGKAILETPRLLLREFDEGDVASFYRLGSDPEVIRYTLDPQGGLKSLEHALEILRTRPIADYQKHGFGRWACVHQETGDVIGFAGLKYLDELQEVDIGYRFLPAYWGQGLATEAGRAIMGYASAHLARRQIIGLVALGHVASMRVLEKLGFTFAGIADYDGDRLARYAINLSR
jgi:[ribosomal protein S5]-alanine N-acetyltransferase